MQETSEKKSRKAYLFNLRYLPEQRLAISVFNENTSYYKDKDLISLQEFYSLSNEKKIDFLIHQEEGVYTLENQYINHIKRKNGLYLIETSLIKEDVNDLEESDTKVFNYIMLRVASFTQILGQGFVDATTYSEYSEDIIYGVYHSELSTEFTFSKVFQDLVKMQKCKQLLTPTSEFNAIYLYKVALMFCLSGFLQSQPLLVLQ